MPSADLVKVVMEQYGWPIVTVAVLMFIVWRTMFKHEGEMRATTEALTKHTEQLGKIAEINENILTGLRNVADLMARHDWDEARRHEATQDRLRRDHGPTYQS